MALAAVTTAAPLLRLSVRPLLSPCCRLSFPGRVYCCSLPAVAVEAEPKSDKNVVFTPPGFPPELSIKEKKELASYAHSLGDKLKSQQVGKSGVTPNVAAAFVESLESNELLKQLKVHNSCPGELPDVVKQLELMTGSVAVGLIGRTVILYRPSITKMKEAERKRQHIPRVRKEFAPTSFEPRDPLRKLSGRGRRGSSRFSSPSEE